MYSEYVDVVNELDQVTDRRPRREVHALNLRHRAVHILVFNDRGCLFLQKRSMKKDLNKGLWDSSAAGHVDSGEIYRDSADRELTEELGVTAELTSLFKLDPTPKLGMEFIQVYSTLHNGPFALAKNEIDEGVWLERDEVSARVQADDPTLTETFKIIWRNYLRILEI